MNGFDIVEVIRYVAQRRQADRRWPCAGRPGRTAVSGLRGGQCRETGGEPSAQSLRTTEAGEHAGHRRDELRDGAKEHVAVRLDPKRAPSDKIAAMLRLLLALVATVVLGLASRLNPVNWYLYDRALGEVLYAVAAYLVLAMLLLHKPPWFVAVLAFACCLAVELFKLTGIPAAYQHVFLVRWFLGMIFSWLNLGEYLIGVLLVASADRATRTQGQPRARRINPVVQRGRDDRVDESPRSSQP